MKTGCVDFIICFPNPVDVIQHNGLRFDRIQEVQNNWIKRWITANKNCIQRVKRKHPFSQCHLLVKSRNRFRNFSLDIDTPGKAIGHVISNGEVPWVQNICLMATCDRLTNHREGRTFTGSHLSPISNNKSNPHGNLRGRGNKAAL